MRFIFRAALATIGLGAPGCGLNQTPQPLLPSQFVRARPAVGPGAIGNPVGQSGALAYGELHSPLLPDEYTNTKTRLPVGISPLVRSQDAGRRQSPAPIATTEASIGPDNSPASQPAPGVPLGYQIVGTVLETVDGHPIYADKVLNSLERELRAEARKYNTPEAFRRAAFQDIAAKVQELVSTELLVAAAERSLSAEAKAQADFYTRLWRGRQISAAGGSEAVARQRALESGTSFDEQMQEERRNILVDLYKSQQLEPQVHVTATDMRRYYQQHLETEFTRHAEMRFRVIRIDFAGSGGKEQAAIKADGIISDLKRGIDFETEAYKFNNDDTFLRDRRGDVGWVREGEYKYDAVEQAVWALKPGEFTDHPIEVSDETRGGAFFIAELEARREGKVQPFDNPQVQEAIARKLSGEQLNLLREKVLLKLNGEATVIPEQHALETALEMAMQRYPVWAAGR
jgi:hypothetical protein